MSWAHVHLAINHLPVVLVPVSIVMITYGMLRKSADFIRGGLTALAISSMFALGVFLTGEPAEEVVEHMAGVSTPAIEEHEEAAQAAAIVTGVAGLLALVILVLFRRTAGATTWQATATLVVAVVAAALLARAANLGGQIRHPEIRGDFGSIEESSPSGGEESALDRPRPRDP